MLRSALAIAVSSGIALAGCAIALRPAEASESASGALARSAPVSEGAAPVEENESQPVNELQVRLGNESNDPDGIFGPVTYGFRGNHRFQGGVTTEASLIRLHEPGTPALHSFWDEAQATLRSPELEVLSQRLTVGGTAWKNRMIDMYTNVGGLEVTRTGTLSATVGLYLGNASLEDLSRRFLGVQLLLSASLGPIGFSASHLNGRIGDGFYRKSALEASAELFRKSSLPFAVTLSLEDRFYDFGGGAPVSDSRDELIVITGLEIHLERWLFESESR